MVGVLVHAGIFTLHVSSHALSRMAHQQLSDATVSAIGHAAPPVSAKGAPPARHHPDQTRHCPICTGAASLQVALPLDQIAFAPLEPSAMVANAYNELLIARWFLIEVQNRGPPYLQL